MQYYQFCLQSAGFLRQVDHKGVLRALIEAICPFDAASQREDIRLECIVPKELEHRLRILRQSVRGFTVIVLFSAQYQAFGEVFYGQTPQDPTQMVRIVAKLLSMRQVYLDGQLMDDSVVKNMEKAA